MGDRRRFEGRSVFITGAGSGIGERRRMPLLGGRQGCAGGTRSGQGEAVRDAILASGGAALFVQTDATDEASVKAAIMAAGAAHGPVRHAFNNIGMSRLGSLEEMSLEDWNWTVYHLADQRVSRDEA